MNFIIIIFDIPYTKSKCVEPKKAIYTIKQIKQVKQVWGKHRQLVVSNF